MILKRVLDFLFGTKEGSPVQMVPVGLGPTSARVPVAVILGNRPGKTLLVTGGSDGDEYAGMEAAYALIERFGNGDFAGKLVVIPVVNMPGFLDECSQNPLDQRFPKMVFPGKVDGTPTERLMHWLVSGYANHADAWLDLHGGAITEGLYPFLWLYESGVPAVDLLAQTFFRSADVETVIFEKVAKSSRAGALADRGCLYVIAESGDRGCRTEEDIERHVGWTVALMAAMGMTDAPNEKPRQSQPRMLRRAAIVNVPYEGIWYPADLSDPAVEKGARLGVCIRLDGTDAREIVAPSDGIVLWWKQTMAIRPGDILAAIGTE
ncbi:MAG: succinylglutamate desuccinylase/aspartoacylase family protein [Candidatus Uhrbacteria bacterium]